MTMHETDLEVRLKAVEQKLDMHIHEASELRKRAQDAVGTAQEAAADAEKAARRAHEFVEHYAREAGEGPSTRGTMAPSSGKQEFGGRQVPTSSVTSMKVWVASLLGTLLVGLAIPARTFPPAVAPLFDAIILFSMGVFGWLGLLAALRERRATTPR